MCSFCQLKHSEVLGVCPRLMLVQLEWARIITKDTLQIKGRVELQKKRKKTETVRVFIPEYVAGRGSSGFSILLTVN